MDDHNHDRALTVLYATESGGAQDAANKIARRYRNLNFECRNVNVRDYPLSDLIHENLVIFVISTTGSGQEPRSMTTLWNMLLRSDLPNDILEDLHFAVFGLGDSSYEKFCWPAKKLSRRLVGLGATQICHRGEGDDQHHFGIDGALDPWIDQLSSTLLEMCPLPDGVIPAMAADLPPPRVIMKLKDGVNSSTPDPLSLDKQYHTAELRCNRRITSPDWYQDVRHIELLFDDDISYDPGDVAVIHPEIPSQDVDALLSTMGWSDIADSLYTIDISLRVLDQTLPDHLPHSATLRTIFTRYLNINAVPRYGFFEILHHFAENPSEKEKLQEFISPEGADDLYEYAQMVRRTIKEVLEEFRSVRIPLDYIFDVFPPLRPREFSIASSVKSYPKEIHLCIAMVNYRTRLKVPRKGVCTSYLSTLVPGKLWFYEWDTILVGISRGFVTLPEDLRTPIICVGPGTGVAPMRAIIQHRLKLGAKDNTLYFGCRSATKDQHYAIEWENHSKFNNLNYRLAGSRDGPEGVRRTYVQHLIEQDVERIWDVVGKRSGCVYISGSSNKMPMAVKSAIKSAAIKVGDMSDEEATDFLCLLERSGRLIEETWS
ncbi:riboflavin synthase domain-like protein [Thelephora ganbajun]|uniref:Riboflavin synthase domain-like protein n=1 Tax=Thelephora ganbajun TaxID=370292 RepID=A0ACB6ZIG8_THEGA|nr:riboflavin synthase domain-like protein [Thelephora ganbajun]